MDWNKREKHVAIMAFPSAKLEIPPMIAVFSEEIDLRRCWRARLRSLPGQRGDRGLKESSEAERASIEWRR